jgi:hypothetical protein
MDGFGQMRRMKMEMRMTTKLSKCWKRLTTNVDRKMN